MEQQTEYQTALEVIRAERDKRLSAALAKLQASIAEVQREFSVNVILNPRYVSDGSGGWRTVVDWGIADAK